MAKAQAMSKSGPRYGDLKRRIVFLILALVVYRMGTHIPVPGINPDALSDLFQQKILLTLHSKMLFQNIGTSRDLNLLDGILSPFQINFAKLLNILSKMKIGRAHV